MSEHSTPEERTELPTEKRMSKLREEGTLPVSTDFTGVLALFTGFMVLYFVSSLLLSDFQWLMKRSFGAIADPDGMTENFIFEESILLFKVFGTKVFLVSITIATVAALTVFIQTKFNVKKKKIHFRFDMLNPVTGIKKVFSAQGVVNTLKALIKLALILPLAFFGLRAFAPEMINLMHVSVPQILTYTGSAMYDLFFDVFIILLLLAVIDIVWTKHQWLKQNRMTKQEVKDERKSLEGDEETKRKIQAKGLQRIAQRIRESVPQADVVITNPTHFAIALKYDRDSMVAPKVVAKGKGHLALRIREIAKESGVPIMERKPLARALYASCEVGAEIPRELFRAVAEVLAFVFRIRAKTVGSTR
jgi:flagellar biosynthetic protein FlhB